MNLSTRLIGVVRFLGSNCDQDAFGALRHLGFNSEYVWFEETNLKKYDGLFLPGGFSHGDYLRPGAIAATKPIVCALPDYIATGKPVLGVCNGFQILCEAQILPGALQRNISGKFICKEVHITPINRDSVWTKGLSGPFPISIAHGDGRYIDASRLVQRLWKRHAAFQYCKNDGTVSAPNGSQLAIAGVLNEDGNVLGMMPHPERSVTSWYECQFCAQLLLNGFAA